MSQRKILGHEWVGKFYLIFIETLESWNPVSVFHLSDICTLNLTRWQSKCYETLSIQAEHVCLYMTWVKKNFGNRGKINMQVSCSSHLWLELPLSTHYSFKRMNTWKYITGKRWQKKPFIEIIKKTKQTWIPFFFSIRQNRNVFLSKIKRKKGNNPGLVDQAAHYQRHLLLLFWIFSNT